jgi:puromycin-sensitive aminopeptidase
MLSLEKLTGSWKKFWRRQCRNKRVEALLDKLDHQPVVRLGADQLALIPRLKGRLREERIQYRNVRSLDVADLKLNDALTVASNNAKYRGKMPYVVIFVPRAAALANEDLLDQLSLPASGIHVVVFEEPGSETAWMLDDNIEVTRYGVQIRLDQKDHSFSGVNRHAIVVRESTRELVFRNQGLRVTQAYVERANGARIFAKKWLRDRLLPDGRHESWESASRDDESLKMAHFVFEDEIAAGDWTFVAEYESTTIQPSFEGFYRSEWFDDDGKQHWMWCTQFEADKACAAFLCLDEPHRKSKFDISLIVPENLVALSNELAVSETPIGDGMKLVQFATTQVLPTYDLAWVIGELEYDEVVIDGFTYRLYSRPGQNHLKSFALKWAVRSKEWYERNYKVKYPFGNHMYMVAIDNFRSGAMEHPGLITFRTKYVLVDELRATLAELIVVAMVVAHEWCHMWCGNTVTPRRWSALPGSEANATFFAYMVIADYEPDWHILDNFAGERAKAFLANALLSTHPVFVDVNRPDLVEQLFDHITYEGGGSIEFMLLCFIGAARFYEGMEIWIKRFYLGNAELPDLLDALEEGARRNGLDLPVRKMMDAWFKNTGHPVVSVTEAAEAGYVTLRQHRFSFLPAQDSQLWPIMVHLLWETSEGKIIEDKLVFDKPEMKLFLGEGFRRIVVNAGGPGFYRVRYSKNLQDRLTENPIATLQVVERYNLLNDAWAFVLAQQLSVDEYLELLQKFAGERDSMVWKVICESLTQISALIADDGSRANFSRFVRNLAGPMFVELGWIPEQGELPSTREARGVLAELLGVVGEDRITQKQASILFDAWKKNHSEVDPDVVPALVSIVAHTGDEQRFDEFVELAKAAPTDQEKERFWGALSMFQQPRLIERAIGFMLTQVPADKAPIILGRVYMHQSSAAKITWEAIKSNWDALMTKWATYHVLLMVKECEALGTAELKADVEAFFATHVIPESDMAMTQMLELLKIKARLREIESPKLTGYLRSLDHGADEVAL